MTNVDVSAKTEEKTDIVDESEPQSENEVSKEDSRMSTPDTTMTDKSSTDENDPLDELKDIDFLLEDIEDKIAPLALSLVL